MDTVQSMIEKYQIPSGKLAVEIDEYALTTTPVIIEIVMQQLKDLGCGADLKQLWFRLFWNQQDSGAPGGYAEI